jgi:hypothetical protein
MISLPLSFAVLIIAYFTYGKLVEKIFSPDERKTPAYTCSRLLSVLADIGQWNGVYTTEGNCVYDD